MSAQGRVAPRDSPRYGQMVHLLALGAIALGGCDLDKRSMFAPSGSVVSLRTADSLMIAGASTRVTVEVRRNDGSAVADGTEVRIDASAGTVEQQKLRTLNGQASVGYQAGSQDGTATLTAVSGDARADLTLRIASGEVAQLRLTATPSLLPPGGGTSEIVAALLGTDDFPVSGVPIVFDTTTGTIAPTRATSDSAGLARATLSATAAASVGATIDGGISSRLTVNLLATVTLSVEISPASPAVGEPVTFTVDASASDGRAPGGTLAVDFGDGNLLSQAFTERTTLTHAYTRAGTYDGEIRLDPTGAAGTSLAVRITVLAPPPPPEPAPQPSPEPPDPTSADALDLGRVIWLHHDVSRWAQTSTLTGVSIGDPPICLAHTRSGHWPVVNLDGTDLEGNPWVLANIDGQWYAGTYEWLRPGQTCKAISAATIGPHVKASPLDSWQPASGEIVGFMVSTLARSGPASPVQERSNVVLVRWP